jgi:putative sugar O-methyltransferase
VKVVGDLIRLFGPLDGMRIIEIGAGYGGQCLAVSTVASPASYVQVDLDPCLALQRAYLGAFDVTAEFVRPDQLPEDARYDLVVSNYAFSECVGRVQRHYVERVLTRADRGYLTMNWRNPRHYRSVTHAELDDAIDGIRRLPEEPRTAPENDLLVWGAAVP